MNRRLRFVEQFGWRNSKTKIVILFIVLIIIIMISIKLFAILYSLIFVVSHSEVYFELFPNISSDLKS